MRINCAMSSYHSTRDVDFWPPKSVLSCNNLPCRPLPKTKMRRNTRGKTSRQVELLARHCLLRCCSGVESMERFRNVAAEEHGHRHCLVHDLLQGRPVVFSNDHCDSKLHLVQLEDVSVLVMHCPHCSRCRARMGRFVQCKYKLHHRRWSDDDQNKRHGWLGSETQRERSLVCHARSNRLRGR